MVCHTLWSEKEWSSFLELVGGFVRCWGSYHARAALKSLDLILPDGLYGCRPKCFAAQLWMRLLIAIDTSYHESQPLCGLVLDLEKAFNTLPRTVVMETLAWMGLPLSVLHGWTAAVVQMARRFQIRGALGPKLWSSSGFAEGDAMSCIAMIGIDALFHSWVTSLCPQAVPLSFVDDWQILLPSAEDMPRLVDHVLDFAKVTDLTIDTGKTYTWATGNFARKFLRSQPVGVKLASRNLGAHIQLSRKHTNFAQMTRINQLKVLWPRLRLSASTYAMKIRALKMACWPRALHGIAATTLSSQTFKMLRAGAVKGLACDQVGCNTSVHLGMVEHPSVDPWFWALLQTFRSVRESKMRNLFETNLAFCANEVYKGPRNSITRTLYTRISKLNWKVTNTGLIQDHLGTFSLFQVGMGELQFRAEFAWPFVVAAQVAHRRGYQGLQYTDAQHTRLWLKHLQPMDAGAFRKLLNGTHMTSDATSHCAPGSSNLCAWCDCADSRFHRFWQCEYFATERQLASDAVRRAAPILPASLTCYGWSLRPSTVPAWLQYFAAIPWPTSDHWTLPQLPAGVLHLFTDGTCADQKHASFRYAAWSVVLAAASLEADPIWSDAGPLPGILQSAHRAELFAVGMALVFATRVQRDICIWCDCASVLLQLRRVLQGDVIPPNHAHFDLWSWISSLLDGLGCFRVTCCKVGSHLLGQPVQTPLELWCSTFNEAADEKAKQANRARSAAFWSLHSRHVQAVSLARDVSRQVQTVQLAISRRVLREADTRSSRVQPSASDASVLLGTWDVLPPITHFPAQAVRWYGLAMVQLIMSWFWGALPNEPGQQMKWISHTQLYVDFQLATGNNGPVHQKKWGNSADFPLTGIEPIGFKQRCRWFTKVLKEILRHSDCPQRYGFQRPTSFYLSLHCGCFGLPWPAARLDIVDRWLQVHLDAVAKRDGRSLDSLPLGQRGNLPEVELIDVGVE